MKYAIPMIVLFVLGSASSVQAGERRFNDGNRGIDGPSRMDPSMRWSDIDRAGPGRGPWINPRTDGGPAVGGPIYLEPRAPSSSNRRY